MQPIEITQVVNGKPKSMVVPQLTQSGAPGAPLWVNWGTTIDLGLPFTTCVISIGCIAAPTEIVPTVEPASDGRPRALANSVETRSRPLAMRNNRAAGS